MTPIPVTCNCGNYTFKIVWTDDSIATICTACERSEALNTQPFTIRS